MSKRTYTSGIISETPVSVIQEALPGMAPRKLMVFKCRFQQPPTGPLQEEWRLETGEKFGYSFNYHTAEVCMYHLYPGQTFSPDTPNAIITSNDWGVLNGLVARCMRGESIPSCVMLNEEGEAHLKEEGDPFEFHEGEEEIKKFIKIIWETKSDSSSKWFYRVKLEMHGKKSPGGHLVLDRFSSENGVFLRCLSVPVVEWMKMLDESADRITALFQNSRLWKDVTLVRKDISHLF